ncbi:MAG: winged helix-turn-helix transcriptional regulator [Bacteroidaceae bacterium]|nr:winged helix-turn-helix transcriptional regulator [Bacteroidaceae bacterium]
MKSAVRIKELMRENKKITIAEIASEIGITVSGVEKAVKKLRLSGEIIHKGPANAGEWEVIK